MMHGVNGGLVILVFLPSLEVVGISDPKCTSAIRLVDPLIQAIVQELDVVCVRCGGLVGVPADV